MRDPFFGLSRREIIKQQVGCAAVQRFVELRASPYFDFDWDSSTARPIQSRTHTASRRDVIVLDQNRIVKTPAMIRRAARRSRHFFQQPQTWSGFASIQ